MFVRQARLLRANLGHRQVPADLASKSIRDLGVARHGFDGTRCWIAPERVARTFAFEVTAVPAKVAEQIAPLHLTVTFS